MLDWCPVCENLIPPERYTIQLPPATQPAPQLTDAPAQDKAPTGGPAKTTAKAGPKRPGMARQNSRGAAKKGGVQQMTKTDNKAAETATTAPAASEAQPTAPPPRQRTIISQEPTPLYCSEKCRLEDEARNNLRPMEYSEVDWGMGGGFAPPFATGFAPERSPLPMPYTGGSPPPHPFLATRSSTSASSSTLNTTITASSDSAHSATSQLQLHAPTSDQRRQRPEFLQMTSMPPVPSPRSNGGAEMSSSAPATTDFTSHPSHAILSELGQPIPHGLPLDRWNTVRNETTDSDAAPRYTSAADLWNTGYTLAIQPGRSRMNSRHPSRMPTPTLTHWEDTTPTQSVLIPRSYRRQDDSLELAMASKRSDSGSSRSATSSSRRRRSRSKRRNGSECPSDHHSVDGRSVASHSRSSRGSIHGPSSYKNGLATSLEDSRRHFRTSRLSSHPLSSSFSARDAEEELRKFQDTQKGKDQPATVSQSVPNDRGSWSRTSSSGKGKELPRVAESTTASGNASPEISKKALAPISTSSSSATIAALPTSISTRTVATDKSSTSSPPKTAVSSIMSSTLSSSKRNSSFANLATAAASLFGLGGLGGLTMTAASPSKSPASATEIPNKTLAPVPSVASTPDEEPIRGRSRASSRAQPSHQLLGSTSKASSSSLAEMTKTMASGGSRLPISMSTADLQVAKRPLGPIPKEVEDKLRGSTRTRDEGTKQPLTVDVSGKRKEKAKDREEGPMTSPPPTSSTSRSKDSPNSAAPPRSAWDPDLVRDLKESRRLSREASHHGAHPNMIAYGANVVHPVNPFLPSSPGSPTTSPGSRSPYIQHHRRRTTSHSQSKSHSRSHSTATFAEEEGGDKDAPLPRVKSNQSITSMTTSSSRRARHSSREPPSPSATVYSIAGPSAPRLPRGMSMTSLSGQGFGMQHRGSMYGNPVSPGGQPGQGGGAVLPRTASQPYMNRWSSGSPGAGGSAFGSPNGPTPPGTLYYGHYGPNHSHAAGPYGPIVPPLQPLQPLQPLPTTLNRPKAREAPKTTGPMYPVLALPTERRKKKVKKTVVDERGQEVEVDEEEEEEVYAKPKRLFYFDR